MRQMASLLLLLFILFFLESCSTAPQNFERKYEPSSVAVAEWLNAFESEHLSTEQCLTLIRGILDVQKMEAIKFIAISRQMRGSPWQEMLKLKKEARRTKNHYHGYPCTWR